MEKIIKSKIKAMAEKKAGPAKDWITPSERQTYIKGVSDGIILALQEINKRNK